LSGAATVDEAQEVKQQTVEIFEDATFTLHKWHSNEAELEDHPDLSSHYLKKRLLSSNWESLMGRIQVCWVLAGTRNVMR
jgi:hypothetical protein